MCALWSLNILRRPPVASAADIESVTCQFDSADDLEHRLAKVATWAPSPTQVPVTAAGLRDPTTASGRATIRTRMRLSAAGVRLTRTPVAERIVAVTSVVTAKY